MTQNTKSANNPIDMKKKYRTRSGLPVRVLCTDRKDILLPVLALVTLISGEEMIMGYPPTGECWSVPSYDLIEAPHFESFKVDDLCVVWDFCNIKRFRYFSHVVNGKATCFVGGTSFTNLGTHEWQNCRKATPEEMETKTINQDL